MNNNRVTCDLERIELFLQQKLSDEEQTAFELHLDDCHDCRRRLEATAADDDIWSGVRDSLRGQQLPPDGLRSGDSALDSATGDDASPSHTTVVKLLAPTDDDRMLGRLGTYEVMGVIGSGGMGVVLKAFDAALNRNVAIKVLAPHLGSSGAARKRFSREAQAAAAVVHDNVMEIYGVADAFFGEAVAAAVRLKPGTPGEGIDQELIAWCADRLARFKVPASVEFRTALPYTETGKVMKHAL
jgi:serine/threonine-protein kinase